MTTAQDEAHLLAHFALVAEALTPDSHANVRLPVADGACDVHDRLEPRRARAVRDLDWDGVRDAGLELRDAGLRQVHGSGAHAHVADERRVDARLVERGLHHRRHELVGARVLEATAGELAYGGAQSGDDDDVRIVLRGKGLDNAGGPEAVGGPDGGVSPATRGMVVDQPKAIHLFGSGGRGEAGEYYRYRYRSTMVSRRTAGCS
eukprot:COSAG01_NODE_1265_length_10990_cov_23.579745_3_plen_205_part_00